MAGKLSYKNRASADAWISKANALNQETRDALNETGTLLNALSDDGKGEIVTKLFNFGTQVISYATQIMDGVSQLCSGLTKILDVVDEIMDSSLLKIVARIAGI